MPDVGDKINFDSGYQLNMKGFDRSSGDRWFAESGVGKTYYLYVSAQSIVAYFKTDFNIFGTPSFDVWVERWDGSQWVMDLDKLRVSGGRTMLICYRSTHIFRFCYQSVGGNFCEYLYGGLIINGYSSAPNDAIPESWFTDAGMQKPSMGSEVDYNVSLRGRKVGRVANGNQWYGGRCRTDYTPYDDPVADLYDTTAFRGSPITASVPLCCFVGATGREDY